MYLGVPYFYLPHLTTLLLCVFIHQLEIFLTPCWKVFHLRVVFKCADYQNTGWDLRSISKSNLIYPKHRISGTTCRSQTKKKSLPFACLCVILLNWGSFCLHSQLHRIYYCDCYPYFVSSICYCFHSPNPEFNHNSLNSALYLMAVLGITTLRIMLQGLWWNPTFGRGGKSKKKYHKSEFTHIVKAFILCVFQVFSALLYITSFLNIWIKPTRWLIPDTQTHKAVYFLFILWDKYLFFTSVVSGYMESYTQN